MMVGKGIFGEADNFFVVHEVLDPQYTRWRFFFTIYVSEFLATSLFGICQLKRGIGLAAYFELLHSYILPELSVSMPSGSCRPSKKKL